MSLKPKVVDFDTIWGDLLLTLQDVVTCGAVHNKVWNDRFSDVYALCVAYPEPLSDRLYKETKSFLENHVRGVLKQLQECSEELLLQTYFQNWEEFCKGSEYLNMLYTYLNTQFIRKHKYSDADLTYGHFGVIDVNESVLEIGELALDMWRKNVLDILQLQLVTTLAQQIQLDRMGQSVNCNIIHGVALSFVDVEKFSKKSSLKLYEDIFEKKFLQETGDHYRRMAQELIEKTVCSEYMCKVLTQIDEEDLRSRRFLHPNSYNKVRREVELCLVGDHLQMLYSQCADMVKREKKDDLKHMYRLLRPTHIGGLQVLSQHVEAHIKDQGNAAVTGLSTENMHVEFVENILDVHKKYKTLITDTFENDGLFIAALDRACSTVINKKIHVKSNSRSPELLAKYCDGLLKKSARGMNESDVDDKLSKSITVFKYLDDKDIFQRFYSRMLAKRLIYQQSQSMDLEEGMINRLKQACGYEFTNKLHRMFTDVNLSSELTTKFAVYTEERKEDLGVSFNIQILQAGAWPLGQTNLPTFAIPQELERCVKLFELFYHSKFNGRKLTWMHNVSQAEVRMNFLSRPYMIMMSTFQMAILLVFNGSQHQTVTEIVQATELHIKDVIRQVQSLLDAKLLLLDDGLQSELKEATGLHLNMEYSNKRTKFKIQSAVQKDNPQDAENTHQSVDEDRKLYLQAAIVRVMKARKILKHNLLIQEVISQARSRFSPSVSMIKKCIEALIDKQYLERTSNTDEYRYVA